MRGVKNRVGIDLGQRGLGNRPLGKRPSRDVLGGSCPPATAMIKLASNNGRICMHTELFDNLVLLRPYRPDDLDPMFDAAVESVAEVGRWLPWCHEEYTPLETAAWIDSRLEAWQSGTEYSFAITERATGRFVGGCGLNQFDHDRQ